MSTVIEKITLYDLLGYALPGSLPVFTLAAFKLGEASTEELLRIKDFYALLIFVCIIAGYIVGIVISEFSNVLLNYKEKKLATVCLTEEKIRVPYNTLAKGLKNAGAVENVEIIGSFEKTMEYWGFMYAMISTDAAYKRIHNYASSETMYKNLSAALLVNSLIILISYGLSSYILINCICIFLLFLRWKKFWMLKKVYTVYWFIDKYADRYQTEVSDETEK